MNSTGSISRETISDAVNSYPACLVSHPACDNDRRVPPRIRNHHLPFNLAAFYRGPWHPPSLDREHRSRARHADDAARRTAGRGPAPPWQCLGPATAAGQTPRPGGAQTCCPPAHLLVARHPTYRGPVARHPPTTAERRTSQHRGGGGGTHTAGLRHYT